MNRKKRMRDGNPFHDIGDSMIEGRGASVEVPAHKIVCFFYGMFLNHVIALYIKPHLRNLVKLFLDLFFREKSSPCGMAYLQVFTFFACTILYHLI